MPLSTESSVHVRQIQRGNVQLGFQVRGAYSNKARVDNKMFTRQIWNFLWSQYEKQNHLLQHLSIGKEKAEGVVHKFNHKLLGTIHSSQIEECYIRWRTCTTTVMNWKKFFKMIVQKSTSTTKSLSVLLTE